MSKLKEALSFHKKVLNLIGLWQDPPLSKIHSRVALSAFIWSLVIPIVFTALFILQAKNVEEMILSVLYQSAFLWEFLTIVVFYKNRLKVKEFLNTVCDILEEDEDTIPFVNSACERVLKVRKLIIIAISLMCVFIIFILPLFYGILPIPMWKPDFISSTSIFYVHWMIQTFTIGYACIQTAIVILTFTVLMLIIGYTQSLKFNISMLMSNDMLDGTKDLVKCVKIHQNIKLLANGFADSFSSIILLLYNIILFIIGASIFALTKAEDFLAIRECLMYYAYIFAVLLFLFFPSYFGQEILSTSEDFLYDLFSSEWLSADLKYKKSMMIFMENLKQPISIKIFIFDYLNLNGFLNAVNSGYSIFTLLNNVKKVST